MAYPRCTTVGVWRCVRESTTSMKSFAVGTCVRGRSWRSGGDGRGQSSSAEGTGGGRRATEVGALDRRPTPRPRVSETPGKRRLEKSLGGGGGVGISRDGRWSRAAGQRTEVIFLKLYCMLAMAASVVREHLSRDGRARASQCPARGAVFRSPPRRFFARLAARGGGRQPIRLYGRAVIETCAVCDIFLHKL